MLKKCISITLALLMLLSAMIIGVNAAEKDAAATGDTLIYFDAGSAGWQNVKYIMFFIYNVETGTELVDWGSKKLRGTQGENNIWSFDPTTIGMEDGPQYAIIFNNDEGGETYQLLMDSSCYGDTAYCTDKVVENLVDSNRTSREAKWRNSNLGPMLAITSLGNVVGETCPAHTTPYAMFVKFLTSDGRDGLQNAMNYANGKTQDEIINSVGSCLGLSDSDIKKAVEEAGLGDKPDPDGFSFDLSVTSFLSDTDEITVSISGIDYYHDNASIEFATVTKKGLNITVNYHDVPAGKYTVAISKKDHVTREYEIVINSDAALDAKICPIGDATLDGEVTTMDVTRANAHVKGRAPLEGYALLCADVLPQTEGITTLDVTRINSHVQKVKPLW